MEILTRDRGFVTRGANPLIPWGSTTPPTNGQIGQSVAGVVISDHTALQLAAVYGSVSIITDSIATLPIRQYKATSMSAADEIDPSPVISQPWPEMTQRDFITQGTASLLLRGNLFGRFTAWDDRLLPSQVQLVHPDHAKVRRDSKGAIEVQYWNQPVPSDNVTRAMALSVPEGLVGLNPVEYMRNVLGLARAQDLNAGAFFANSSRPDGVIQVPGDLDVEETKAMKNSWLESHQGINHSYLPAVLTGDAKFLPITMSNADAQFLEQMQYSASAISGMIYRVPPHMIGMVTKDTSWGCLPGDSLVFTTTGPKPIADIEAGDEVWSMGESSMEPKKVVAQVMTGHKPLLTIKTTSRVLRATSNHRVPIRRYFGRLDGRGNGDCGWENVEVEAGDIRPGDFLMVPHGFADGDRDTAPNGRRLTVAAMELCGLYIGDGSQDKNRIEIAHGVGRDADHIPHYAQAVRDEFGVEPYTDKRRTRWSSTEATSLIECGFTGKALTKRVPNWVFRLKPELRLAFLRGYLDSDGGVARGRIVYSSANKALLDDVRHLCIGLGIPVGSAVIGRPAGKMDSLAHNGRVYDSGIKYQLNLSSAPFNSRIGSHSPHKAAGFTDTPHARTQRYDAGWMGVANRRPQDRRQSPGWQWDYSDVILQRVISVTEDALAVPVYDIEVEGNHNFVADGVVVHNSGIEQQELGYVRNTLLIWLNRWEDLMSSWLPKGQFVMFDLSQRLRGDTLQRFAAYQIARVIGAMNNLEVREAESMPIPTDPAIVAELSNYSAPLNSAPMPAQPAQGGDHAN